jgi:hypothetical protein
MKINDEIALEIMRYEIINSSTEVTIDIIEYAFRLIKKDKNGIKRCTMVTASGAMRENRYGIR